MNKLEPEEYNRLDYFKNIQKYSPTERLLRYKRNVIGLGGFLFFFIFAGINIQGFSGGFIKGTIQNPEMVFIFLSIFNIYNYFMFYIILRKEIETHDFTVNNLNSFGVSIMKYIIKKEIGKFVEPSGNIPFDSEYEPKNFVLIDSGDKKKIKAQFTLDPEIKKTHKNEIEKLSGFEFDAHTINIYYEINDNDKIFYKENKNLLRQAVINEFMDYVFPKYFGLIVLLLITYRCIKII